MSWRTVIIGRNSKLDYRMGYLVVRADDVRRIFLDEIAILVIENPAVSMTGCLLAALTEHKIRVMFCDAKHNPLAELQPYYGTQDTSLKVRGQAKWKDETKDAVWQLIIREKITKQADHLTDIGKLREADQLLSYLPDVLPGDTTNREGFAAKVYFNALYGMDFTRGADIAINAALNYGYSILLSAMNREIISAGYITQLGIFHDNRFNQFNLSSDLMEPFRVLVDRTVTEMMPDTFERGDKHALWNILSREVSIEGRKQTVLNAMRIYTRTVLNALDSDAPSGICFYQLK